MNKSTASPTDPDSNSRNAEYQRAIDGYQYRDQLIPHEFASMLQVFVVFSALIAASQTLATRYPVPALAISAIIAITGFMALLAYATDIESNTSCKGALRDRGTALEKDRRSRRTPRYWKTINKRERRFLEKLLSGKNRGAASSMFIRGAQLLLVLWIVVAAAVLFWGQVVLPRG